MRSSQTQAGALTAVASRPITVSRGASFTSFASRCPSMCKRALSAPSRSDGALRGCNLQAMAHQCRKVSQQLLLFINGDSGVMHIFIVFSFFETKCPRLVTIRSSYGVPLVILPLPPLESGITDHDPLIPVIEGIS